MADAPAFIKTPRLTSAAGGTANLSSDGTGAIVDLIVGATGGTRVLEVVAKVAGTSAAAQVNLFISRDGGATWQVFDSLTIAAATVSASVASSRTARQFVNLCLEGPSQRVGFSTTVAQQTVCYALAGDLL